MPTVTLLLQPNNWSCIIRTSGMFRRGRARLLKEITHEEAYLARHDAIDKPTPNRNHFREEFTMRHSLTILPAFACRANDGNSSAFATRQEPLVVASSSLKII